MANPKTKVSLERVMEACGSDEYIGFCLACGSEAECVEPDARNYPCDVCGAHQVFGAEECLIMLV